MGKRECTITEAKKRKAFKERGELSIVSNILKSPADKLSVGFGDLEAIDDCDGSLFPVMDMEAIGFICKWMEGEE